MVDIITRKQAVAIGLKRYFTGEECMYGHIAQRLTSNKVCLTCFYDKQKKRNPQKRKEYNQRNAKTINKNSKKWRDNNPQDWKESRDKWRSNNKEKYVASYRASNAKRKSKTKLCNGKHSAQDIISLLSKQKYKCANCKISVKNNFHVDHIVPLKLNGTNDKKNLQILCPNCNCSKRAKHPIDWAQENGRLL
jgi:DNA-directed RNA polymerase subunit RPC12/RpoP